MRLDFPLSRDVWFQAGLDIGNIKLATLTPRHVQAMVGCITDSGSKRTANQCRTQLFSALKQAVRWEPLSRT
jgi:hypothetical protein